MKYLIKELTDDGRLIDPTHMVRRIDPTHTAGICSEENIFNTYPGYPSEHDAHNAIDDWLMAAIGGASHRRAANRAMRFVILKVWS